MKKLISIILLSMILFYAGGMYLVFRIGENILEVKARKKIELISNIKDLVAIKDSGDNSTMIKWEKPGKEFRYKDQLYDIVLVTYDDGRIPTYLCYADNDETNFLKQAEKIISRCAKKNNTDKTLNLISKVIAMLYVLPDSHIDFLVTAETICFNNTLSRVPTGFLSISTPPPDQA